MITSDFMNQLRESQKQTQNEQKSENKAALDWASNEGAFYNVYNQARQARGEDPIDYNDFTWKTRDFIGRMGVEDGKWTQEDFDNRNYSDKDYDAYANELMGTLFGGYSPVIGEIPQTAEEILEDPSWDRYLESVKDTQYMDKETREAYERMKNNAWGPNWSPSAIANRNAERFGDNTNWWDYIVDTAGLGADVVGSTFASAWNAPYNMTTLKSDMDKLRNWSTKQKANAVDMLDNYETYIAKYHEQKEQEKAESGENGSNDGGSNGGGSEGGSSSSSTPSGDAFSDDVSEGETVSYAYKPGDTFGQVVLDLGLGTGKGLWGTDGDVAFYNKQLWEQNAIDPVTGNIPIGTVIKLRKRKSN